ncbi:Mss4-like superfamily [Arabidopsis suecica]|uniref:Peptide-methionine (R)-S-oxide reductase n=1 Tax=Arabidopsis suecica TaxID=45249 RepID=A0A8T1ZI53_ARASU|nr:Mss4-like superfamily [Arabidopsis suecica]
MEMTAAPEGGLIKKSNEEWRAVLSPEQFKILREKAIEKRGSGEYVKLFEDGIYCCVGCGNPVYKSTTKFDSGCGWPAFFDAIPGAINRTEERAGLRYEITCTKCDGHLGHVLKNEGFPTPTNERHCINSVALKFSSAIPSQ